MTLVEDCTLRLDDPVDPFLPELADMTVLADPNGPLENTVPANRPVTLRDLLTYSFGSGMVLAEPGTVPIADALNALQPEPPADEYMRRLGALPLVYQPGEAWLYDTAADVTGVLIARATGKSFGEALHERICAPLGMTDTAFSVDASRIGRLATAYQHDDATGELAVHDRPDGLWSRPPVFEGGGGGLVSTANDYLAFASALLAGGTKHGDRVLSRPSVTLMTTNHQTPEQKANSGFGPEYFDDIGWGFGLSVRTRRTHLGPSVGSYGWPGYYGTAWYNDPAEDMTVLLMIQRNHTSPFTPIFLDLWTAAYAAIDD
jgi:CubicO group peptidase (beta-lactamase class C family)